MNFTGKETTKRKGFTLIELVVVIAILGLLMAMAVPRFTEYQKMAKIAVVDANAKQLTTAAMSHTIKEDKNPATTIYSDTELKAFMETVSGVNVKAPSTAVTTIAGLSALTTAQDDYAVGYITTAITLGGVSYQNAYATVVFDPSNEGSASNRRVYIGGSFAGTVNATGAEVK